MSEPGSQSESESRVTQLSARDRDRFLAILEDELAIPNEALTQAAQRYKAMREIQESLYTKPPLPKIGENL